MVKVRTTTNYSPSIADLLLATLMSGRSVKRFRSILRERSFRHYKEESVQVTLSRLHKKRFVKYSASGWSLSTSGKRFTKETQHFMYLPSPFKEDSPDTTIVSFDIPESDRKIRNWLRNQIKIFGYKMLQQSLWLGPGPLPTSFLQRLEKLKIKDKVKIFSKVKKTP